MNSQTKKCPACGLENETENIFCKNEACHKALGEFKYILEEINAESSLMTKFADGINKFTGKPHFVTLHLIWFLLWVILNSTMIAVVDKFDPYPYGLLGIILAIEATLITSFLLISNNRQNQYAEKRSELEYEVNVLSYRSIEKLISEVESLTLKIANLENKLQQE